MAKFEYINASHYRFVLPINRSRPVVISVEGLPDVDTDYISIVGGQMYFAAAYAWDGPTGWPKKLRCPKWLIRSSLAHDGLYQLMREGHIDRKKWREYADRLLQQICIADGGSKIFAGVVYQLVRMFGKKSTMPAKDPRGQIITITTGS